MGSKIRWWLVVIGLLTWVAGATGSSWSRAMDTLLDHKTQAIHVDGDGIVLIGTDGGEGVYRYDEASRSLVGYGQGLGCRDVTAIAQGQTCYYVGTWGQGVFSRALSAAEWQRVLLTSDYEYITAMVPDGHTGAIYVGSNANKISRIASCGGSVTPLPTTQFPPPEGRTLVTLFVDRAGVLYAGFANAGVWRRGSDGQWQRMGALEASVFAVALGPDGRLWIGTDTGIHSWDGQAWQALAGTSSWRVRTLILAPEGCLFAGLETGEVRWRDPRDETWKPLSGSWAGRVDALASGRLLANALFVGAENGAWVVDSPCPVVCQSGTVYMPLACIPSCSIAIDEFGDTDAHNDLGKATSVATSGCAAGCQFSAEAVLREFPDRCLRLTYDLQAQDTESPCIARYSTELGLNAEPYGILVLEVRGNDTADLASLRIGLSDIHEQESSIRVEDVVTRVITGDWQAINIPLSAFGRHTRLAGLDSAYLEVRADYGRPRQGEVQIDSLRLQNPDLTLMVDNFEDGDALNALDGELDPATGGAATIDVCNTPEGTHGASLGCCEISYHVPCVQGCYAVCKLPFPHHLDVSQYEALFFYVRRVEGDGDTNLWLASGSGEGCARKAIPLPEITTQWAPIRIPLSEFVDEDPQKDVDLSDLSSLEFGFEWNIMSGTIALDDICFVPHRMLLDDFCDDDARNSWLQRAVPYGNFNCNPEITVSLEQEALHVSYDIPDIANCYCYYESLIQRDLSPFRSLEFDVKGDADSSGARAALEPPLPWEPWPRKLKLSDYLENGVTRAWQRVRMPFAAFTDMNEWPQTEKFVLAFEHSDGVGNGSIWIDNVAMSSSCVPLWVDNFSDGIRMNALEGGYYAVRSSGIVQQHEDGTMRLDYEIGPGRPAGLQTDLVEIDLSTYASLAMDVNVDSSNVQIGVSIKDATATDEGYLSITDQITPGIWSPVVLSLHDFYGRDLGAVEYLVVDLSAPAEANGTVYVDNIRFLCPSG